VFSFPGARETGARDSRPFSFPDSWELKCRHSREKRERVKDTCSLNETPGSDYSAFKRQLLVSEQHPAAVYTVLQLAKQSVVTLAFPVTSHD